MKKSVALATVAALAWLGGVTPVKALGGQARSGPGDVDCSGVVDYGDIDHFVAALGCPGGDPACWTSDCPWLNADCNLDEVVDYNDIDAFVALIGTTYNDAITEMELAGNSLAEYPYFEYVTAFNEDATVELAVDTSRYPELIGATPDVYVVATKTAGEWQADPILVDVTAGGPMTIALGEPPIQENTFVVVGANELSGGDGLDIGLGYDVVLDCNHDGMLDGGDYIDGLGGEAGLYVVHDLTQPGPYAVSSVSYDVGPVFGLPTGYGRELTYYPSEIASLGELPLVTIAHGGGAVYTWYTYLQEHLASYGYIVMCHDTNDAPGVETASTTTLGHTDAIIGLQDQIADGVLDGHIDAHRIVWIGHSRGGEAVVRAYDRLVDGEFTPTHYTADDIALVSSMAPTVFLGPTQSDPHDVPFVLWVAPGDSDVSGYPSSPITQSPILHDRATGFRHTFSIQGVGHSGFWSAGGSEWFSGPCPIGVEVANLIVKTYHVALVKYYTEGTVPAVDFFWRQHEHFKPAGIPTGDYCTVTGDDSVVITKTYHNGATLGNFVIDDYQFGVLGAGYDDPDVSSSGGVVTYTVENVYEGRLDDADTDYTWTPSDPMNGMIQAGPSDDARGVVFDWNGADLYYEQGIITEQRDFTPYRYLSFRACQGTRHPYTAAVLGDLTFSVTLRDGSGASSSINIGAYGGGIEEPFQRAEIGVGAGWFNEFETIRIRLTDYLTNASGLDLTDIVAVRFDVGPSWGSGEGRIGLDDIELTRDVPPRVVPVTIQLVSAPPEFVPPGEPADIDVEILPGSEGFLLDSAVLYHRTDGGAFESTPLVPLGGTLYRGMLPAPSCGERVEFYASVAGTYTGAVTAPPEGAAAPYGVYVGTYVSVLVDSFETDQGWTVENDPSVTGGAWERAVPSTDGSYDEPTLDFDGSGHCYVTQNTHHGDLDGGPTRVVSPTLDMSGLSNPVLRYARWWANDDQDDDPYDVEIGVYDAGSGAWDWYLVERVMNIEPGWVAAAYSINEFVPALTDQMKVRFSVADVPNNSKDEAGVDAVEIFDVTCE